MKDAEFSFYFSFLPGLHVLYNNVPDQVALEEIKERLFTFIIKRGVDLSC